MKKIVIIDTYPSSLLKLTEEVESAGYDVSAYNSAITALEELQTVSPDFIIVTENLGDMDITEFIHKIHSSPFIKDVPFGVITTLPRKYKEFDVITLEPPFNVENIKNLLKKTKIGESITPFDTDIFKEVLEEVLGEEVRPKKEAEKFKIIPDAEKKEFEHKIDILKRDSQILLQSKDKKILDLKRKIDALEMEISELSGKLESSYGVMNECQEKASRALKALKLAMTQIEDAQEDLDKAEKSE